MSKVVNEIEYTNADEITDQHKTNKSAFDIELIKDIEASLTAVIGETKLSVSDLYNLKVGEVVELEQLIEEPVKLVLGKNELAQGRLIAVDDCYGVEITSVSTITD
ncbi:FliM/FliN family flagellar motor switch protein [Catenovulum sp. SM1970]|uniref:FliM/FliN family flagellar motor switch protein n=1 Tax=Marinifaba aquimaris TaxID=2741323 RepID=UPI001572D4AB|nr:FliM/FliN family flagellar motor C-terminal domain-containing protein [Marinifaba aquimaris]NTS77377.1 FliM/FliN family flagellar motor switch protein [Marinifaba aquimaris]